MRPSSQDVLIYRTDIEVVRSDDWLLGRWMVTLYGSPFLYFWTRRRAERSAEKFWASLKEDSAQESA